MDRSKERAKEILALYLDEVKVFEFVQSIILVGSLSDDTYTGNVGSDIDLVHIVADEEDYCSEKKQISELISKVEHMTNHEIPISKVILQRRHLKHPYHYDFELSQDNMDLIERPIELFRILDSGITVYGEDIIQDIERPAREDVAMSVRLAAEQLEALKDTDFYNKYIQMRDFPTIRIMSQIVLTTAMSEYFFYTGNSCSSKYYILERMEKECPHIPYLNLLKLSHKYRFAPDEITERDVETMNREYQACFRTRPKTW